LINFFFKTSYPAQGPTNPGDQSHDPLTEGLIEARAKFCMDWPITGIVGTSGFELKT